MSKIDGIYCVLIKADLKMLVLLKKRSVENIAIFTFVFSMETLYAKTDFELTILLWKSVATE